MPPGFDKLPEMVALAHQARPSLAPASTSLRLPGANGVRVAMLSVNLGQAWLGVSNDHGDFDAARTQALRAALQAADPNGACNQVFAWNTKKQAVDTVQTKRIGQAVAKSCPGKHTVDGFDDGEGDELVVLLSAPADGHDACVVRIVWDVAKATIVAEAKRRFQE